MFLATHQNQDVGIVTLHAHLRWLRQERSSPLSSAVFASSIQRRK